MNLPHAERVFCLPSVSFRKCSPFNQHEDIVNGSFNHLLVLLETCSMDLCTKGDGWCQRRYFAGAAEVACPKKAQLWWRLSTHGHRWPETFTEGHLLSIFSAGRLRRQTWPKVAVHPSKTPRVRAVVGLSPTFRSCLRPSQSTAFATSCALYPPGQVCFGLVSGIYSLVCVDDTDRLK